MRLLRFLRSWWWVGLLVLPLVELSAHALIAEHVVPDRDFAAAAAFVRSQLEERDLITSAPSWTDPLLRLHLGDRMPLAMVGRSDDAAYERVWVLSAYDALPADAPRQKPDLEQRFGELRVLRFSLGKSHVLFDFASAVPEAQVEIAHRGHYKSCHHQRGGVPRGGGLGHGVLLPVDERFDCDPRKPWLMVGRVVMEDLSLMPRYCIWQHAQGDDPVRITFSHVPLGDELVIYGGLYYEHERMRRGGPVYADIFIDGEQRARFTHGDGDGWERLVIPTPSAAPTGPDVRQAEVRIEVQAPEPDQRSFCWSATTRAALRDEAVP